MTEWGGSPKMRLFLPLTAFFVVVPDKEKREYAKK